MKFDHLANVPPITNSRIRVSIPKSLEKTVRNGHPWLFERSIIDQNRDGEAGELAVMFDSKKRFLAIGLYDPESVIRVKILQAGKPATINQDWFAEKMASAFDLRKGIPADGYRLIHGENDGFPSLILDRYADTFVLKLYSTAWLPHLHDFLSALWQFYQPERVVLRLSRNIQRSQTYGLHDGMTLYGTPPTEPVIFRENGLSFSADVLHGHKTGFFFDQRDNRSAVRELSKGYDVLDVFAYSGGFSVYAAAGGARSVVSLDISEPALINAQENFRLNQTNPDVQACQHEIVPADAFEMLQAYAVQGRSFDMVIVDAPSFAKSQDEIDRALMAYGRLARLASALLHPKGVLVMASCSSRITAEAFFNTVEASTVKPIIAFKHTFHAPDHPIGFPEGAYLKCYYGHLTG